MKSIVKLDSPLVSPPSDFKGDFFKGAAFWKDPFFCGLLFAAGSLNFSSSSAEIQGGLIGVGLINMEDRSGVLSLDKGSMTHLNTSD